MTETNALNVDQNTKTDDALPQQEIKRAAQLSITEISIGSIGHGFKIPLTGQVLSLNQLGFLLNALNRDQLPRSSVFEISSIAAILKSFSPAGQKLGPMLSIAMQGFLFWLSVTVFGAGWVGQIVGAILLSIWAFIQPVLTLLFIFGPDLVKLIDHYAEKIRYEYAFLAMSILVSFAVIVILKMILAITLVILSRFYRKELKLVSAERVAGAVMGQIAKPATSVWRGALRDLTRPLFLLSFILMIVFLWQMNGSWAQKIWMALRPLGVAFVIFYILRSPWVAKKILEKSHQSAAFSRIYQKAKAAFEMINK